MALAGDQQHIARLQCGQWRSRIASSIADLAGPFAAARIAARMLAGFSLRGLSSVTMIWSASRMRIAPISGVFPRRDRRRAEDGDELALA